MSDAATAIATLERCAGELDKLSKFAGMLEEELEPVEREYHDFVDAFEVGCWERHVKDHAKLPSEAMREKLARAELPTALLGKYGELMSKRRRIQQRIALVKTRVSANQSILSALKTEAEASGYRLRGAA